MLGRVRRGCADNRLPCPLRLSPLLLLLLLLLLLRPRPLSLSSLVHSWFCVASGVFLAAEFATAPLLGSWSSSLLLLAKPTAMASSSNAIAIPRRKDKHPAASRHSVDSSSSSAASTPSTPSYNPNPRNYHFSPTDSRFSYRGYGGGESSASSPGTSPLSASTMRRRESLMSATFSKAEHTVINVGEEECPRLITCVKASQGFDWNQEIFLPSYADYHFDDLECRQDPVQDIILTDEEIKNMFPS
ncbi:hypothetical protein ACJQWK_07166 [Exserohilum turcicum]